MSKNNNKQKKSLIFSTAVVITGCIATAIYVNQTMNTATDYKIDLSQMDVKEEIDSSIMNDPQLNSGASLAHVSGEDVVNTYPIEENMQKEESKAPVREIGQKEEDEASPEESKQEEKEEKIVETASESVVAPATDLSFSEEDGMGWPLAGDVILNYSMDSAVYFATLMQYKYNPAILIGAAEGTNVSACARGQVVKISESAEQGRYVVMNIGDGYEVTYGQLQDLQVEEGDMVSRGQVIGSVAKTTKYYSVEGDHVSLMVMKDGASIDPLSLME